MPKENILDDRWFIRFTKIKAVDNSTMLEVPDVAGHIEGEVADGWFYGAIVNNEYQHIITKLFHVSELKDCRFYHTSQMTKENWLRISKELSESGLMPDVGF